MKSRSIGVLMVAFALGVGGCTTTNETNPQRSATEELLISGAADRAAAQLDLAIPRGTKVFIDPSKFDVSTIDGKYALGQIEDKLVRSGAKPVGERKDAEMVVQPRVGALSIDDDQFLIGIPKMNLPIPLAGTLSTPEVALYKKRTRSGIAKFAATAYGENENLASASTDPKYGLAHEREWTVLLFFSWKNSDVAPENKESGLTISSPSSPLPLIEPDATKPSVPRGTRAPSGVPTLSSPPTPGG